MTNSTNPLAKHFRQPQLYIKLPSGGRWYSADSLESTATGELPVFAMTAKDELTLKTPDALLNGQSTVDVIQSCVPSIKNAWLMPSVDLDAVLIAIRLATYGHQMDFTSVCPHCGQKNEHAIDLGTLASQITCPDFNKTVLVDGLEIFIKPQTYKQFNKAGIENFDQQRLINVISDEQLDEEEKMLKFNALFKKLLELTVEQVTKSVAGIKTEDGTMVEDRAQLDEFFKNCNKTIWNAVKDHLTELGDHNPLRRIPIVCEQDNCGKSYETPLVFEMSNFFASGF